MLDTYLYTNNTSIYVVGKFNKYCTLTMYKRIRTKGHIHQIHWLNMRYCRVHKYHEQARAELGQAQLKLGLDFTLIFRRFGFIEWVWGISF